MQLNGYNMIKADRPVNAKPGGVCILYKEELSVHVVNLSNLSKCIICEASIQNNKGYIGVVHRLSSHSTNEFENFCQILKQFHVTLQLTMLYLLSF